MQVSCCGVGSDREQRAKKDLNLMLSSEMNGLWLLLEHAGVHGCAQGFGKGGQRMESGMDWESGGTAKARWRWGLHESAVGVQPAIVPSGSCMFAAAAAAERASMAGARLHLLNEENGC